MHQSPVCPLRHKRPQPTPQIPTYDCHIEDDDAHDNGDGNDNDNGDDNDHDNGDNETQPCC